MGILRDHALQHRLPVTLVNYGDNSLLGAEPNGINNYGVDEPDVAAGPSI
jgi:hypothetical protein